MKNTNYSGAGAWEIHLLSTCIFFSVSVVCVVSSRAVAGFGGLWDVDGWWCVCIFTSCSTF
jgi:hypothetical protein